MKFFRKIMTKGLLPICSLFFVAWLYLIVSIFFPDAHWTVFYFKNTDAQNLFCVFACWIGLLIPVALLSVKPIGRIRIVFFLLYLACALLFQPWLAYVEFCTGYYLAHPCILNSVYEPSKQIQRFEYGDIFVNLAKTRDIESSVSLYGGRRRLIYSLWLEKLTFGGAIRECKTLARISFNPYDYDISFEQIKGINAVNLIFKLRNTSKVLDSRIYYIDFEQDAKLDQFDLFQDVRN